MKYLLDTNAMTAWAKKDAPFVTRIQATPPSDLAMSVMTEHELLFGIACNPSMRLRPAVERLMQLVPYVDVDSRIVARAATIRADLRLRGLPIGPYDLLIAATALVHGFTMVTANTLEFDRVPGLTVENWLQAPPHL
jgi:tRNA(fMet)-specific endonuclease VapC